MPIWLITLAMKAGIPSRFAKVAAWLFVALIVVIASTTIAAFYHNWLEGQRNDAVALDRADITQEVTNRIIAADREANANAVAADTIQRQNEKELDDAARNVSDPVRGVLERMREQQASGKR